MVDKLSSINKSYQNNVQSIIEFTGAGFIYGLVFGSVIGVYEGVRESPVNQRLSGVLHHCKAHVPIHGGKLAMICFLMKTSALSLSILRKKDDMWNIALAGPIAGAITQVRKGSKATLNGAWSFATIGFIFISTNTALAKITRRDVEKEELLEEISFAEELPKEMNVFQDASGSE
jgi:hypothetical protein